VLFSSACAEQEKSYLERLAKHQSHFKFSKPAPQAFQDTQPPAWADVVEYPSSDLSLKAWFALPNRPTEEKVPGVVFLHGGFAFAESDIYDAKAFLEAGFALMAPMLRGENGNPGSFELFLGEVDDAIAAAEWLAAYPRVDPHRVYVFGHSIGGGIAALIALREGVPCVHTGSAGGLYSEQVFERWRDIVPFDYSNMEERNLRLLLGNQRWMKIPHLAYIGDADSGSMRQQAAENETKKYHTKLSVETIPGDHYSSLPNAIESYIKAIELDDT
jgi:dienelactone hydrolase